MAFEVIYKPLAQAEVAEAYEWYEQEHIVAPGRSNIHFVVGSHDASID